MTAYNSDGQIVSTEVFSAGPGRDMLDPGDGGSSSGCKTVDYHMTARSIVFRTVVFRYHLRQYWCWDYPTITRLDSTCYASDVDPNIQFQGCTEDGYYYSWNGSSNGGHYSQAQGNFTNCVLRFGCWRTDSILLQMWARGDGGWTGQRS